MQNNFLCEYRLRSLDPALHRRFCDSVLALQRMLNRYQRLFPNYTDHTVLHSLNVIDFCNHLIGSQVERLNADALYVLLMSCYLHDMGMGISDADYQELYLKIDFGNYFCDKADRTQVEIVRDFHQEFSGLLIQKYAALFDIPSQEHLFAIVQVARGHRKTDLNDLQQYPVAFPLPGGNTVCLPYLAAIIRMADELDIAADRNPALLYDTSTLEDERDIRAFESHRSIRKVEMTPDCFRVHVEACSEKTRAFNERLMQKMQRTLDECADAIDGRTPFCINQKHILMPDSSAEGIVPQDRAAEPTHHIPADANSMQKGTDYD